MISAWVGGAAEPNASIPRRAGLSRSRSARFCSPSRAAAVCLPPPRTNKPDDLKGKREGSSPVGGGNEFGLGICRKRHKKGEGSPLDTRTATTRTPSTRRSRGSPRRATGGRALGRPRLDRARRSRRRSRRGRAKLDQYGLEAVSLSGHSDLTTKDGLAHGIKAVHWAGRLRDSRSSTRRSAGTGRRTRTRGVHGEHRRARGRRARPPASSSPSRSTATSWPRAR